MGFLPRWGSTANLQRCSWNLFGRHFFIVSQYTSVNSFLGELVAAIDRTNQTGLVRVPELFAENTFLFRQLISHTFIVAPDDRVVFPSV